MAKCILHVGIPKTGTTSIQNFLKNNRSVLRNEGVLFPSTPRVSNQREFSVVVREFAKLNVQHKANLGLHTQSEYDKFCEEFRQKFSGEIMGMSSSIHTVVISSESLVMLDKEELVHLQEWLAPMFDELCILIYLRRQDAQVVSNIKTKIIRGGNDREHMSDMLAIDKLALPAYLDFATVLDRFAAVFGEKQILPRIFDREEFAGGDLIQDLLEAIGSPISMSDLQIDRSANTSIDLKAAEFMRRLNQFYPRFAPGEVIKGRVRLDKAIERLFPGKVVGPSQADAKTLMAKFEQSNEVARKRWFPHKATLFSEDYSSYPEERVEFSFDVDDAMRIASVLLKEQFEHDENSSNTLARNQREEQVSKAKTNTGI